MKETSPQAAEKSQKTTQKRDESQDQKKAQSEDLGRPKTVYPPGYKPPTVD